LAGHAEKRFELYISVAIGAGNGRTTTKIVADERTHDAVFELVLEIDYIMRKVEMLGDAPGVVDVVERTAAM
jgi:hypothetical protein